MSWRQVDQLILYLLQPGRHQEPDARCMGRLVKAAKQEQGNCTLHAWPLPALGVLERMRGFTADAGLVRLFGMPAVVAHM